MQRFLLFFIPLITFISLISLITPPPALSAAVAASPSITITQIPSSINADEEFSIAVSLSGLNANTDYRVKSLGTINNEDKLKTLGADGQTWLAYNGGWDYMPKVTANSEGSASATLKSKFYDTASGQATVWIRIRQDSGSTTNYDSSAKSVAVNSAPSPSPSPSPSSSPNPSPSPSGSSSSTPTPTPSPKPSPSKRPSPSPSPSEEEESPPPSPRVLGKTDEPSPSPSPSPKPSFTLTKGAIVSYSLVGSGLLFLLGAGIPLIIRQFKSKSPSNPDTMA